MEIPGPKRLLPVGFVLHTNKMEGSISRIEPSIFTYLATTLLSFGRGQHSPASAGNPAPIGRSQSLTRKVTTRSSIGSSIGAGCSTKLLH